MKRHARLLRTAVVGGASLAMALSLAACGGSGDSAGGGSDEIHVLVYGDATNKVEKQLVDTFNKTSIRRGPRHHSRRRLPVQAADDHQRQAGT
ncbi:hypothetical protein STANM309S_00584 [Streptomyces tanashiensis]